MKFISSIIILMLAFVPFSCGSAERSVSSSGTTNVVLDLGQRETSSSSVMSYAPGSISPMASTLPSSVGSIRIQVTDGEGGEVLVDTTVDVTGQSSVELSINVPNGSNRVFIVSAYCSGGDLLYQGSTTADLNGASVTLSVTMGAVSSGGSASSSGWTHPASLSDFINPVGSGNTSLPKVAMDDNGNAIIVWYQPVNGFNQIFKSEYRSGSWTHPSGLSDHISIAYSHAYNPQVAMDNNGNAIIVWYQRNGAYMDIYKSEYRSGSWTHPAALSDNINSDGMNALHPQVAMDNNGNAVITWYEYINSATTAVFMSEYRGSTWTHPSGINDFINVSGGSAVNPVAAMDNNGNAMIVWSQYTDGGYQQIFKSEYRSGSWAHPSGLSDNISPEEWTDAENPQVAMDDNGSTVVLWQQNNGSNYQIYKSEYREGIWAHPSDLNDHISPAGMSVYHPAPPRLAMDGNKNTIIVWSQLDSSENYQIFKSEYRSGSWTYPADINDSISPAGRSAFKPDVSMDKNGNAIISWYQYDSSGYAHIFKSEYRSGSWTHPSGLTDNISIDGTNAYLPETAMDDDGNALIVWYQADSSGNHQIFKSEYR